jgi:hypothetical protein
MPRSSTQCASRRSARPELTAAIAKSTRRQPPMPALLAGPHRRQANAVQVPAGVDTHAPSRPTIQSVDGQDEGALKRARRETRISERRARVRFHGSVSVRGCPGSLTRSSRATARSGPDVTTAYSAEFTASVHGLAVRSPHPIVAANARFRNAPPALRRRSSAGVVSPSGREWVRNGAADAQERMLW